MLMSSCGSTTASSDTTCHDGNGSAYDNNKENIILKGCHNAFGKTIKSVDEAIEDLESSNTTTTTSSNTTTTTNEERANWVYGDAGDAFVAPFVQPVCDTLRQWKAPAETTKEEFNDFSKQVAQLKKMIGSPSEPTFSDTYWLIYSFAEEALDYERRHPNDEYSAFTASMGPRECDRLNFTTANSKFGLS